MPRMMSFAILSADSVLCKGRFKSTGKTCDRGSHPERGTHRCCCPPEFCLGIPMPRTFLWKTKKHLPKAFSSLSSSLQRSDQNLQIGPFLWQLDVGPAQNLSAASLSPPNSNARTWTWDGQHWRPEQQCPRVLWVYLQCKIQLKRFPLQGQKTLQRLILKLHLFWGCWPKIPSFIDPYFPKISSFIDPHFPPL